MRRLMNYYREQQNKQYQKQEDKDWKAQTTSLKNINNPNEISSGNEGV